MKTTAAKKLARAATRLDEVRRLIDDARAEGVICVELDGLLRALGTAERIVGEMRRPTDDTGPSMVALRSAAAMGDEAAKAALRGYA